ncbi:restriction endonuclease [Thiopseudomonas acetoxidans]|uniref:Restriction endonuclease n=1 Tax=Thiopseudomonas acetoxidans TaxID=3041622 RepID=A0ABT7SMC9_9GAMM|nr:restriction endonuclease [Thiopseudomonas sp. CY1220]MDM7857350.1 restriction endonuclease [Thiopseudomonas sp. CY1220]
MPGPKIYLTRTPYELVKIGQIGYGWPQVNFSEASTLDELVLMFRKQDIDVGRQLNQIKRFYSIKAGDIVVVPLPCVIAIGYATGIKTYKSGIEYGENRIGVNFLRHDDGSILRIPRDNLTGAFSSRLKIRMTVVSLSEFKDEVIAVIERIKSNGITVINSRVQELEEKAQQQLKYQLLQNICEGKTYLESGGYGLEKLVAELLMAEGYEANILDKAAFSGQADADILAVREDRFSSTTLLVQVKHHTGTTGFQAVRQLESIDEELKAQKWIVTSAKMNPAAKAAAEKQDINIIEGESLVDWIVEQSDKLSRQTLHKLGISSVPTLLTY